ncbi:hypothetical protein SK066_02150 [Paenibacillus hunanensis]|uniref:stalk domain-containing protein n=1 Tax=Paenibacillus hunanensis TaxID=539262 RepID=UPI002A69CF06|nr:hypothetical protein [Paenibacillus hunanensis]WPP41787.1 hypothetical protein SK066_02150 [Paenibacillus hunanensis]
MKKTKWLFPMMLAGMMLAGSTGVYAGVKLEKIEAFKNHGISIELNGQTYTPVNVDGQPLTPITYQGSTYLPIRAIGETMNTSVLYDAVNNKVLIGKSGAAATPAATATTQDTTNKNAAANTAVAPSTATGTSSNASSAATKDATTTTAPAATSPNTSDAAQGQSAPITPTPGPIDTLTEPAPPVYNVSMTTGIIQSSYLSADFPFPADAERVSLVEQVAGGKKQLSLVYRTQADLQTVGNAYVDYYTGYNMEFGAKRVASSGISIVGIVNDAFGVSIQGNPMSLRPGYNSVSVILAEQ